MKRLQIAFLLAPLAIGSVPLPTIAACPTFVLNWRPGGDPKGVATDSQGNVYVAEPGSNRIVKFTGSGQFLGQIENPQKPGFASGSPEDVAIGSEGNIYTFDSDGAWMRVFSPAGVHLFSWGGVGAPPGRFGTVTAIAIDETGDVYVADQGNNCIQKFTSAGQFIQQWNEGPAGEQFLRIYGIATYQGFVYVVDAGKGQIVKSTSSGVYVSHWDVPNNPPGGSTHVDVDSKGNLYLVNHERTNRVYRFASDGQLLCEIGQPGTGDGEFSWPFGIAVDGSGNVFISEPGPHIPVLRYLVQKFAPDDITPVKASTWGKLKAIYR